MEHDSITKAILEKTREVLNLFNKYFVKELAETIGREYNRGDGAEYYEAVLKELLQHGYLRFKAHPMVGFNTYWYENSDGKLWFHEIPGVRTKSGDPVVVSCAVSDFNRDDYIVNKYDYPYSY